MKHESHLEGDWQLVPLLRHCPTLTLQSMLVVWQEEASRPGLWYGRVAVRNACFLRPCVPTPEGHCAAFHVDQEEQEMWLEAEDSFGQAAEEGVVGSAYQTLFAEVSPKPQC